MSKVAYGDNMYASANEILGDLEDYYGDRNRVAKAYTKLNTLV